MRSRNATFLICMSLALSTLPIAASAGKWVAGKGSSCEIVCKSSNLSAVGTPNPFQNGETFYVCRAKAEGQRPGYNLAPDWSNACYVGQGGKEKGIRSYSCLCE